jgi:hypothetical protein
MSILLSELLKTLSDDALARRMAGFKAGTEERILGEQEFARRQQERAEQPTKERVVSRIKVFISHSSKDKALAKAVVELFRAALGLRA